MPIKKETRVYAAVPSAYVALLVITGLPTALALWICFMRPQPGSFAALLTCLAAVGLAVVWLRRFRIEIDGETITYRSLTHNQTVRILDIESVRFSIEPFADPAGPTVRLTLKVRGAPSVVINAKVFSREAIRDVRSLASNEPSRGILKRLLPR